MSVVTKQSKTLRVLALLLVGNTSDGIIFKGQFKRVRNKMLWKLTWGFAKFSFRGKRRQKFQQWRKMYCLDIFQMNHFWFFCMLQTCVFQYKSIKRKNCNKRMWFCQSDLLCLISNILMWVENGIWKFSLQRNLKVTSFTFSFLQVGSRMAKFKLNLCHWKSSCTRYSSFVCKLHHQNLL